MTVPPIAPRFIRALLLLTCTALGVCAHAHAGDAATMPSQSATQSAPVAGTPEPGEDLEAKRRDVLKLLELNGTRQAAVAQVNVMTKQLSSVGSMPPGMVEAMKEEIDSALDQLIALSVAPYMRHISHADIKAAIAFYETPAGQRVAAAMSPIASETSEAGMKWGQEMGMRIAQRAMQKGGARGAGSPAGAGSRAGAGSAPAAAAPGAAPTPEATQPDSPEAAAIVERIQNRYAQAKTYRDKGRGSTSSDRQKSGPEITFSTAFARGGGFRWEFSIRRDLPFVLWSTDCKAWSSWWKLRGKVEMYDTLHSALAVPTGISSGLAQIVPLLLRADSSESTLFSRMTGKRVIGHESVSGVECEMIEGTVMRMGVSDGRITLWVDETGAIRKYVQESTIDPPKLADLPGIPKERAELMRTEAKYRSTTTFVFEPEFDVELAPDATSFTPPAG